MSNLTGKPQFGQGNSQQIIRSMEFKIQELQAQLAQQAALTGLIEATTTGFCSQLKDPQEIARLVLETSGAIAFALQNTGDTEEKQ